MHRYIMCSIYFALYSICIYYVLCIIPYILHIIYQYCIILYSANYILYIIYYILYKGIQTQVPNIKQIENYIEIDLELYRKSLVL